MSKPDLPTKETVDAWAKAFFAALGAEWVMRVDQDYDTYSNAIGFYQAKNAQGFQISLRLYDWLNKGKEIHVEGDWSADAYRRGIVPDLPKASYHKPGQTPAGVVSRMRWYSAWYAARGQMQPKLEALIETDKRAEAHAMELCLAIGTGRPSSMAPREFSFYADNIHGRGRVTPSDPPLTHLDVSIDNPELAIAVCRLLAEHKQVFG